MHTLHFQLFLFSLFKISLDPLKGYGPGVICWACFSMPPKGDWKGTFLYIFIFFFIVCISYTTQLCFAWLIRKLFLTFFVLLLVVLIRWGHVTVSKPRYNYVCQNPDIGVYKFLVWVSGFHAMLLKWAVFLLMNLGFVVCSTLNLCSIWSYWHRYTY